MDAPDHVHEPGPAWRRGVVYLALVNVVGLLTGTWAWLVDDIAILPATNAGWAWGAALVVLAGLLYGGVWARGTTHANRPSVPGWSLFFGLIWGFSAAMVMLVSWRVSLRLVDSEWVQASLAVILISAWQGVFHDVYWDMKVSPEHNLPEWNARKVALVHVPNLAASATYLAIHDTVGPVVAAQVLAIVISCIVMRFPAPNGAPSQFGSISQGATT